MSCFQRNVYEFALHKIQTHQDSFRYEWYHIATSCNTAVQSVGERRGDVPIITPHICTTSERRRDVPIITEHICRTSERRGDVPIITAHICTTTKDVVMCLSLQNTSARPAKDVGMCLPLHHTSARPAMSPAEEKARCPLSPLTFGPPVTRVTRTVRMKVKHLQRR